jgi:hypothetical protein
MSQGIRLSQLPVRILANVCRLREQGRAGVREKRSRPLRPPRCRPRPARLAARARRRRPALSSRPAAPSTAPVHVLTAGLLAPAPRPADSGCRAARRRCRGRRRSKGRTGSRRRRPVVREAEAQRVACVSALPPEPTKAQPCPGRPSAHVDLLAVSGEPAGLRREIGPGGRRRVVGHVGRAVGRRRHPERARVRRPFGAADPTAAGRAPNSCHSVPGGSRPPSAASPS